MYSEQNIHRELVVQEAPWIAHIIRIMQDSTRRDSQDLRIPDRSPAHIIAPTALSILNPSDWQPAYCFRANCPIPVCCPFPDYRMYAAKDAGMMLTMWHIRLTRRPFYTPFKNFATISGFIPYLWWLEILVSYILLSLSSTQLFNGRTCTKNQTALYGLVQA